jgi:hypothetical protein
MNIAAIDPGPTTGLAVINQDGRWTAFEMTWQDAAAELEETALACKMIRAPLAVAGERFDVSQRTVRAKQQDVVETIGMLQIARWITVKYNHRWQQHGRDASKSFASNEMLRKLGWYTPSQDGHANDATRVLTLTIACLDPVYWRQVVQHHQLLRDAES